MSRSQRHREAAPSFVAGTREALRCTRLPKASLQFPKAHASLLSVCSSCSTAHAGRSQTTPLETRPHSTSAFTPPASATQWRPRVRRVSLDAQVGGLSPPPDHLKRPPSIAPSVPGRTRGGGGGGGWIHVFFIPFSLGRRNPVQLGKRCTTHAESEIGTLNRDGLAAREALDLAPLITCHHHRRQHNFEPSQHNTATPSGEKRTRWR